MLNKSSTFEGYEIHIETTSFCNAKCIFCPNSTLKRPKNFMSDDVFNTILKKLKREKLKVKSFALHLNGEPLLDKKIVQKIKIIRKMFKLSKIRFTTNLELFNYETFKEIINAGLDEVTVSLNTTDPNEYRELMGLKDYNKTLQNLKELIKLKQKLKSKIIINVSIVERDNNKSQVENFENLWKKYLNVRIIKLGQWVNEKIPQNYEKELKNCKKECNLLYNTIVFLSNGEFGLCCFDAEGIINENIMNKGIREVYFSGKFNKIRNFHKQYGLTNSECKNCSFR